MPGQQAFRIDAAEQSGRRAQSSEWEWNSEEGTLCFTMPFQEPLICLLLGIRAYLCCWGYMCRCTCGRCLEIGFYLLAQFSYPSFMIEAFIYLPDSLTHPSWQSFNCSALEGANISGLSAAFVFIDSSNLENPSLVLSVSLHHPVWSCPSGPSFSHLALPPLNPGHSSRLNISFSGIVYMYFSI